MARRSGGHPKPLDDEGVWGVHFDSAPGVCDPHRSDHRRACTERSAAAPRGVEVGTVGFAPTNRRVWAGEVCVAVTRPKCLRRESRPLLRFKRPVLIC